MIEIKIKDGKTYGFEKKDGRYRLNGDSVDSDLRRIGPDRFHIVAAGRSYEVELISTDEGHKRFVLKIDNATYEAEVSTPLDLLLERMGMQTVASSKMNMLKAPMPGLIADVRVGIGDEVAKDTPLLVLEAMKMENMIKSHGEGRVKKIAVSKGDHVEKGQVLMEFE